MSEIKAIIEALLFAAEEPLSTNHLLKTLNTNKEEDEQLNKKSVQTYLDEITESFEDTSHGIELVEVNGGYQFRTKANYSHWIHQLNTPKPTRLSKPAIESLSIIAYRQPLTRGEVDDIRGVDSGGVVKGLLERRLIKIVGRKEEPGRPILYGTTPEFLELFALKDLKELPPLKELEEQAREIMRRSQESEAEGGDSLEDLAIDISELSWLDEKEKETFAELDEKLNELKDSAEKADQIINPKEPEPVTTSVAESSDEALADSEELTERPADSSAESPEQVASST